MVRCYTGSECRNCRNGKLANNAWIDLNIALANDLARLTDTLDQNIDILEVG